jgi:hypothetical protein
MPKLRGYSEIEDFSRNYGLFAELPRMVGIFEIFGKNPNDCNEFACKKLTTEKDKYLLIQIDDQMLVKSFFMVKSNKNWAWTGPAAHFVYFSRIFSRFVSQLFLLRTQNPHVTPDLC